MEYKNYYKILGIDTTASQDEIKRTYRKLAVKFHPDKNQGDKKAEDRFKEISEAYDVLGDPKKRKKYDEIGKNWKYYDRQAPYESGRARSGNAGDAGDSFYGSEFSSFFESFFGNHSRGRSDFSFDFNEPGHDLSADITVSLSEAFHGTHRIIDLGGEKIRVSIKPGVPDGLQLKVKGKGAKSKTGHSGNLLLSVRVETDPVFTRKGDDLITEISVDLYTVLLGGSRELKTLSGKIQIKIPEGSQNGKVFRLAGKGMPVYGKPGQYGNLYAKLKVVLPEALNKEQKIHLRKMKELEHV